MRRLDEQRRFRCEWPVEYAAPGEVDDHQQKKKPRLEYCGGERRQKTCHCPDEGHAGSSCCPVAAASPGSKPDGRRTRLRSQAAAFEEPPQEKGSSRHVPRRVAEACKETQKMVSWMRTELTEQPTQEDAGP